MFQKLLLWKDQLLFYYFQLLFQFPDTNIYLIFIEAVFPFEDFYRLQLELIHAQWGGDYNWFLKENI